LKEIDWDLLLVIFCLFTQVHNIFQGVQAWRRWDNWATSDTYDRVNLVWGIVSALAMLLSLLYLWNRLRSRLEGN